MLQRCHINRITRLENDQGQSILTHNEIEKELINYYKNILTYPNPDKSLSIAHITQHVPALFTEEKNTSLLRSISIEEVDQAMKEMSIRKYIGPNGFTTDFFHHSWPKIK